MRTLLLAQKYGYVTLVLITVLLVPRFGYAQKDYENAGEFVNSLGSRAMQLFGTQPTTDVEQERRFRLLLQEGFAVKKIGHFVLGKYRRSAREDQIEEFLGLFEDYIVSIYSSAFKNFAGETFTVARVVGTKNSQDTMVITHINPDEPEGPTKVVFQVRKSNGKYKILDVRIAGISMIVTQRDEFTGFIRNNGGIIGPLLEVLRKRTVKLKTRAEAPR